jgi:antitoxin component YwqK of YwqJK toxin-antitoxin module
MQISLSGGKRNGTATVWLPNGTIHRQMTYDRGVPTGEVLELDIKTGQVKRSATYVDGRALTTSSQKGRNPKYKKSEEQFLAATTVEKAPDDFWTLTLAKYEAEGEDLRHGPSKIWFDNGKIQQEGYYEQGKRHGTFTFYYETGQVAATGEYKDDQPNDIWVWWHSNGQKATVGQYRGGKQVGQWRWWDQSGTLVSQSAHDEGPGLAAEPNFDIKTGMAPPAEQFR